MTSRWDDPLYVAANTAYRAIHSLEIALSGGHHYGGTTDLTEKLPAARDAALTLVAAIDAILSPDTIRATVRFAGPLPPAPYTLTEVEG